MVVGAFGVFVILLMSAVMVFVIGLALIRLLSAEAVSVPVTLVILVI